MKISPDSDGNSSTEVLDAVRERYSRGAQTRVPELCCPVDYRADLLEVIPTEIVERDYGCGDPSRFVRPDDRVLDLGCGGGKICYMASQIAGPKGHVIGVDATHEMLAMARKHQASVAERIGWDTVEFRFGHIQDLALDRERLDQYLDRHPVKSAQDLDRARAEEERLRSEEPLIADASVDLVLSNCVLNLVADADKRALFREIHRVLARGGRCAISDIVSDEDVPEEMRRNESLWTGCISGALREDRFLDAFVQANLYGVTLVSRQEKPWAVVEGIEFRPLTVLAYKGKEGACMEHNESVIYRGPWKRVVDDDGHVLERGQRTAVCRKTFEILTREPYADSVSPVPPLIEVPADEATEFDCRRNAVRDPGETKRGVLREDRAPGADESCCGPTDRC